MSHYDAEGRHPLEHDDRLSDHYMNHVMAMTKEKLHSKSDIAIELAWRDWEIEKLRNKLFNKNLTEILHVESLYNSLKGHLTFTRTPEGDLVGITIQDEDHKILDVLWEKP